jgi:uncharacterized protein (TIGR03435 family)
MKIAALFAIGGMAVAQPSFEVASVRLTPPDRIGFTHTSESGAATFTATNVTLELLIAIAFRVETNRILAKQSWIESEHYDVSAKAEGGQGISDEQLKPLLRQLLADRFKLSVHREPKEVQGYSLQAAKGGPKLEASKGSQSRGAILRGGLRGYDMALDNFASMLSTPLGRPVINETGIDGKFDISLDYAIEGAADSTLPSIFTALQERLGLKLVPQKVRIETLVIDHAERVPAEN